MLGWHSGASQTHDFYKVQLLLCELGFWFFFLPVVTFMSVQAYGNSTFSLELICKREFDPYQL